MSLGGTLTILIPLVVGVYALWLVFRMLRDRKQGKCGQGCLNCPLRDGCDTAKRAFPAGTPKPDQTKEEKKHE